MKYIIEHPREIKSVVMKTKSNNREISRTLSVEQRLDKATEVPRKGSKQERDGVIQDPLKMFAEYSVYRFTLIEKVNGVAKTVYANIPVSKLSRIEKRTEYCTNKIIDSELENDAVVVPFDSVSETKSIAYTQKIGVGSFKGKTPVEILLNNPKNKTNLLNTAQWLKEHESGHANNKVQRQAILEAVQLLEDGKLNGGIEQNKNEDVSGTKTIKVYEVVPGHSLESTRREDGKLMTYEISISCNPANKYPYSVRIANYWSECNGILTKPGTVEGRKEITMVLSEDDWDDIVEQMRIVKDIFVRCYGKYEMERALTAENENRERARQQKVAMNA